MFEVHVMRLIFIIGNQICCNLYILGGFRKLIIVIFFQKYS